MPRINLPLSRAFRRTSKSWTLSENVTSVQNGGGPGSLSTRIATGPSQQDASNWEKFKLLLWKNYTIQKRHKIQTFVEILLPIVFTVLLVVIRCVIESHVITHPTTFPTFDVNVVPLIPRICCKEIYYAPKNPVVDELMSKVHLDFFNKTDFNVTFSGFETEKELVEHYESSVSTVVNSPQGDEESEGDDSIASPILAGIVFTNEFPQNEFPSQIKYKIRFPATPRVDSDLFEERFGIKKIWLTETLYPIVQLLGPRGPNATTGGVPGYYEEGFLYVQQAVERSLAKFLSHNSALLDDFDIKLQRFPYPEHIDDKFLYTLQGVLPLTLILSFVFSVINITKSVVVEKEKRLKEYMKMMGLPNWLHWASHFLKSFLFLSISTLLITILLKIRVTQSQILEVLPNSDPTVIYVALLTHIFQLVCFAFFISTLFKTANSAAIVAAILWFIFFIPFAFLQPRYNQIPRGGKIAWSFLTNIGACFCCQLFCMFEGTGVGAQWSTVFRGATPDDTFCLADCMLVMIFNGIFYMFLTIYVEAVRPGDGIPQPWYFIFTKWYWTGSLRMPESQTNFDAKGKDFLRNRKQSEYFENMVNKSNPGIQIQGLTKKFGEKVAVKDLHLNMFEDEVFVLIGHNAAGKTTTMSLLAGIFPPSSGTALINGFDICKDMKAVRRSLGLCPQQNILFSELTVEEHLIFYSVLKGLDESEVDFEVQRMMKAIGLEQKKNTVASALSGGMKRRLSLGIAFCANSKVVLLDEPSSGLDPGARRAIWDLIQSEKKGRTILLSTHYMNEADVLGDRIAIMAEGELQCCGSSLFLKKKYGCGYHLVIVKDAGCNVKEITRILKSKLEDIEQEQNVGSELSYSLPDDKSHLFAQVFEELERKKEALGIASYGASITTIEEVFMRVGQLLDERDIANGLAKQGQKSVKNSPKLKNPDVTLNVTLLNGSRMSLDEVDAPSKAQKRQTLNSGILLQLQQFRAMVLKKLIFTYRKYGLLMGQIAICVIYPSLVLFVLTTIPGLYDAPAHPIVLEDYERFGKTIVTVQCNDSTPICQGYKDYLSRNEKIMQQLPDNDTIDNHILELGEKDLAYMNFKYFIGFEEAINPNGTSLIGHFNNQPLHTPPLALNYITNALLNSLKFSNQSTPNSSSYSVEVTNHPFQYGANFEELGSYFTVGFQVGLHFSLAMGFMVGIYCIFPIKERTVGSKHLQFVSGVNFIIFWISNFLVDLLSYFLPCLAIHMILIGYQVQDFYSVTVQLYLLLLFYCYAFAVFPMMYLSSLFFKVPSSGLVGMGVFNVLTGYATLFVISILENPELDKGSLTKLLHRMFMVIPTYALGKGITQISINYQLGKECRKFSEYIEVLCESAPDLPYAEWCCEKRKSDYLDWEEYGIGKNLVYLGVYGLVFWTLLLCFESGLINGIFGRFTRKFEQLRASEKKEKINEDDNVAKERKRIKSTALDQLLNSDNVVIRNLTKMYPNGTLAVDRISLGIKKGECFGLLGANGAGKTSTFKMLTGELPVTSGDAFIYNHSVRTNLKDAHRNIGNCPQFDALIDEMTARETLWMFARLRGVPEGDIHKMVSKLADDLLFTEFLDRVVKNYSGGNKRKLSTAVALVGNPEILFLDEPTCGIDPIARRHLWECIARIRDAGTSVILTSHSMEETEFLCTRLAIMVNGRFRCLGSPQQLKSKFGDGYTLTCQTTVTEDELEDDISKRRRKISSHVTVQEIWKTKLQGLRDFIEGCLPGCTLEDIHQGFLHYRLNRDKVTWAQMFTVMEAAKEKFNVEAYSVGETSLEQVFLNFTKAQYNNDDTSP